jgi:hypothetical protein
MAREPWESVRRGILRMESERAAPSDEFELEDVIDPADLDHYNRILRPASYIARDTRPMSQGGIGWRWSATVDDQSSSSSSPPPGRPAPRALPAADPGPVRRGGRAEAASSDQRLEPYPAWCWDVCGYYRCLDVHWRASRLDLRRAYQRLGGDRSRVRTYAISQLMDPALRREYDLLPFGTAWLKDRYVQQAIKRMAAAEAGRRAAADDRIPRWRRPERVTVDDVLGEMGFGLNRDAPDDEDGLPPITGEGEPSPPRAVASRRWASWESDWAHYRIGSPSDRRLGQMGDWQAALLRELGRHGARVSFAVGAQEKDHPDGFTVMRSPSTGSLIIFLAGDRLTGRVTARAVVKAISVLRRQADH